MNASEAAPGMENKCPQCGAPLPSGTLSGLCPACLLKQGATETVVPNGPPFQPPTVEELSRLFPQLEIIALIGRGGMGAVYKARQRSLDRLIALKILPPHTVAGPGFAERFNREARALARLNHPNIVAVYEFGQIEGLPFFIMEYVDGPNLRQLERTARLSSREALQIVPQICEALQFAHDEGIVHRDIKPENILIDKKGRIKIADFGIAKIMGGEAEPALTETKGAIGTPHYMAPEQMEKPQTVDHRADIFSLGVVFYEMLTGELPLGRFAPPSTRGVAVDVRLDEVVLRTLEKEPERRYQAAGHVKTAVETIAGSGSSTPPPDPKAFTDEILARDYQVNIGHCLQRAIALVTGEPWPIIGVCALVTLLVQVAYSSFIGLIVGGPLLAGLWLYFLKKARGERATLEMAFSGFGPQFVPLFLTGLVAGLLTILGFICLLLPGIYLSVIWMFPLKLIIDRKLDFWPAMELSRQVVGKHFWKCLGLWLAIILVSLSGIVLCGIGVFLTVPIGVAMWVYAYEDIFSSKKPAAATGPEGTMVIPPQTAPSSGFLRTVIIAGAAVAAALILVGGVGMFSRIVHQHRSWTPPNTSSTRARRPRPDRSRDFGPVTERTLNDPATNPDNALIDLDLKHLRPVPSPAEMGSTDAVVENSGAFREWAARNGIDAAGLNEAADAHSQLERPTNAASLRLDDQPPGRLYGIVAYDMRVLPVDEAAWDSARPATIRTALAARQRAASDVLTTNTATTWFFETREGAVGVLQFAAALDRPSAVTIRYKLASAPVGAAGEKPATDEDHATIADLTDRFAAARSISMFTERDEALVRVAIDAAKAGNSAIAQAALGEIKQYTAHDDAASSAALELSRSGHRQEAIAIAKTIKQFTVRDRTLSAVAQ
jgi:predicted Ser/Thr protein kinase